MATQADSIKTRSRASSGDELAVIVQRAQAFTNASGAAIAVGEGGNTDEIICRARSGSSAPDVGTSLRVEGSFTGICIQSGKELRCDDAETDTRVDTAAIRALGIRSMVVTPIKEEGKVVGVLAVFAPTPHAFTITHVAVLKTMADQIAVLLQRERRAREEGHYEPSAPPSPKPVASASVLPAPPVVIKPSATSGGNGAAAAPARSQTATVPKVEPIRPVPVAADIAPPVPVPLPKKVEKRVEKQPEFKPFDYKPPEPRSEFAPAVRPNLSTLDTAGEQKKPGANKLILIGGIVAMLAVGGAVFGFMKMGKSSKNATQQAANQQPQNPAPQPAAAPAANTTTVPVTTAAVQPPSTPPPARPEKNDNKRNENKRSESQRSEEQPSKPATIELSQGNSKLSAAASAPQTPAPDVAPSLAVGGGSSDIGSLIRPVSAPKPAMAAQSNLVNAVLMHTVPAVYPEIAKSRHLTGTVILKVMIGKDGKVSNPRFLNGPVIFHDAAFDAVKQWTFKPAMLNGQPIEQETQITMKFNP